MAKYYCRKIIKILIIWSPAKFSFIFNSHRFEKSSSTQIRIKLQYFRFFYMVFFTLTENKVNLWFKKFSISPLYRHELIPFWQKVKSSFKSNVIFRYVVIPWYFLSLIQSKSTSKSFFKSATSMEQNFLLSCSPDRFRES